MKKYINFLVIALLFISCEPNVIGDFDPIVEDNTVNTNISGEALTKKGVCFTFRTRRWSHKTNEMGAHWIYNWGPKMDFDKLPDNVEYVPMFWGRGSVNDENINYVKDLVAQGKVKYVLGFNEPDGAKQANMTVDEAIDLWPRLEEIGVPLVSPAPTGWNNEWFNEFMQKAEAKNLRIDYIAVHSYGGPSVSSFLNQLEQTYNRYGKRPIWITEFAVADWATTTNEGNRYSEQQVQAFMQGLLPKLDQLDYVKRYSWFDGIQAGNGPALYPSKLYVDNEAQTVLGQIYAASRRNINVGHGVDTDYVVPFDPDELFEDRSFEESEKMAWGGYNNRSDLFDPFEAHTGNFLGRAGNTNQDGSLIAYADVEPGETYIFSYHAKWGTPLSANQAEPTFVLRNDDGNALILKWQNKATRKDTWEKTTNEFTVPAGVTRLRFVFWKAKNFPPLFLDELSLKKK